MPASEILSKTILELAGLADLTGPAADRAVAAILDDHQLLDLAWKASCRAFIPDVLRQCGPAQLAKLVKRLGCGPAEAPPKVAWRVCQSAISGVVFIGASVRGEEMRFDGPPENASTFTWRGETVPTFIVEEYKRIFNPGAYGFPADYWAAVYRKPKGEATKSKMEEALEQLPFTEE